MEGLTNDFIWLRAREMYRFVGKCSAANSRFAVAASYCVQLSGQRAWASNPIRGELLILVVFCVAYICYNLHEAGMKSRVSMTAQGEETGLRILSDGVGGVVFGICGNGPIDCLQR
jgi:hypothetical protein